MKKSVRCTYYLPRRLVRIIEDISPLFLDLEANDPERGAMTKALEYIIQKYMESEDYQDKLAVIKKIRWRVFLFVSDKEHKLKLKKD